MATVNFSGIASGIDGNSIIKAVIDARRTAEIPLQNKIAFNTQETDALQQFNTKLLALQSALNDFMTLSGGAVKKIASSSNSDILDATANPSAIVTSASVTVKALAKPATFSFDDRFTNLNQPIAPSLAGPSQISFTVGTPGDADPIVIDVTNTTTLNDLVGQINDKGGNKILASVVNMNTADNPQYALIINGQQSGLENGQLQVSVGPELQAVNALNYSPSSIDQAQDAVVNVTGIGDVLRSTNTISDIIPGITLKLKSVNASPVQISVSNDAESTAGKLASVISAYNDLVTYSSENSKITSSQNPNTNATINTYGSLAKTRVDDQAIQAIRTALQTALATTNSEVRSFPDLGVKTSKDDGTLQFDQAKFTAAVDKDPIAVNQILNNFADQLAKTQGIIASYTQLQGQIDLATTANDSENTSLNDSIARMELTITAEQDRMKESFTNLEIVMGKLNSQASALSAILTSLSSIR